jgi:hypothetical protein
VAQHRGTACVCAVEDGLPLLAGLGLERFREERAQGGVVSLVCAVRYARGVEPEALEEYGVELRLNSAAVEDVSVNQSSNGV